MIIIMEVCERHTSSAPQMHEGDTSSSYSCRDGDKGLEWLEWVIYSRYGMHFRYGKFDSVVEDHFPTFLGRTSSLQDNKLHKNHQNLTAQMWQSGQNENKLHTLIPFWQGNNQAE